MTSLPLCSCLETGMAQCPRHGVVKQPRAEKKPAPKSRRTPMKRGKMKEVPDERRGFWHGVMATKLRMQEEGTSFVGFYRCECGDPDCFAEIEGFDEARRFFQPGHVKPRASFSHSGFRFNKPTLGPDDPDNIVPVTPECNRKEFWKRQEAS